MTTKIFWPDDLPLDAQDVLYGWKLAPDWFVVAFGVSVRPSHVKTAVEEKGAGSPAEYPLIRLNEIRQPSSLPYQYILYKCPNIDRLRFFATQPLELDTGTLAKQSGPQYSLSNRLSQLYEYYPSPSKGAATRKLDTGHLDTTLSLINETYRVRKDVAAITEAQSRRGARAGEHAPSALNSHSLAVRTLSDINFRLFTQLSALTSWINVILFLPCAKVLINIAAFSAVARQLHLRMSQIRTLPAEWRSSRRKDISLEEKSRRYINFYNTVWLIANDLIVGWTISAILKEHTPHIEHVLNGTVRDWLMTRIIAGLQWLDDWPVGLKLNAPLSRLFAGTYAGITTAWLSIIEYLPITTSALVWLLTSLSLLGVSMFISTLLDILSLVSLHLRAATSMSGVIYRAEMAALYALWNLFRGKRWNTLRNRVDSYDYEIDQLFLGTLLFTIALFLLPTIVTYYLFFALIWLSLLYLQGANDTALSFINSFPLFALMLRFKEPSRLPGGVCFRLKYHAMIAMPYLELTSMPIGLRVIFGEFGEYFICSKAHAR